VKKYILELETCKTRRTIRLFATNPKFRHIAAKADRLVSERIVSWQARPANVIGARLNEELSSTLLEAKAIP